MEDGRRKMERHGRETSTCNDVCKSMPWSVVRSGYNVGVSYSVHVRYSNGWDVLDGRKGG